MPTLSRHVQVRALFISLYNSCSLVLEKILSAAGKDEVVDGIHQILRDAAAKVDTDEISLEKYIVNKVHTFFQRV